VNQAFRHRLPGGRQVRGYRSQEAEVPRGLKVCSPTILHKTDVGVLCSMFPGPTGAGIQEDEGQISCREDSCGIASGPEVEVIVGLTNDSTFGLTIMFGLGGIYTEVYKDVTFRVVPIKKEDAEEMLKEIKAAPILEGFRKIKVDRDAIVNLLMKVSALGEKVRGQD